VQQPQARSGPLAVIPQGGQQLFAIHLCFHGPLGDGATADGSLSCQSPPSPRCEIRQLVVHIYPGGIKAHDAERLTVFYGRCGRPVKKPRFIPAERAHFWARRLQARRLGTVSVV
jgi:hypothetical protein